LNSSCDGWDTAMRYIEDADEDMAVTSEYSRTEGET
jgi:hypothetical protein